MHNYNVITHATQAQNITFNSNNILFQKFNLHTYQTNNFKNIIGSPYLYVAPYNSLKMPYSNLHYDELTGLTDHEPLELEIVRPVTKPLTRWTFEHLLFKY